MGFSYMRSKLKIMNRYGNLCLNKPLCGQISLEKAMNLLRLSHCLHSPFNLYLSSQVSRSRMPSSVVCLCGLHKVNNHPLRFIHSNRALITARIWDLILQRYRQLAGQLARGAARSPFWRWLRTRKYGCIDFCIVCPFLFGSLQWVPYSNRIHLVSRSDKIENFIGRWQWKSLAKEAKGRILSPTSPESVRVQTILRDIVQAMHDGLGLQHDCHVSVYAPKSGGDYSITKAIGSVLFGWKKAKGSHSDQPRGVDLLVSGIGDQKRHSSTSRVGTKGECDDSSKNIVRVTGKKNRKIGLKYGTKHLERLNWEVMVVNSDEENACYLANGKIVFYTGFLKRRNSTDAEIATVLAHEVGHGVGRHHSEMLMRLLYYIPLLLLTAVLIGDSRVQKKVTELIFKFFGRRRELEADYIGLMLTAAAGYDPRTLPKFYRELDSAEENMFSTHPSGKAREKKLSQEKVMKKALEIYEQSRADDWRSGNFPVLSDP